MYKNNKKIIKNNTYLLSVLFVFFLNYMVINLQLNAVKYVLSKEGIITCTSRIRTPVHCSCSFTVNTVKTGVKMVRVKCWLCKP